MSSYDYRTGLVRSPRQPEPSSFWYSKLLALVILLLCLAVGMMGLILPVIPGFLFLMLALLCAAKLSPALAGRLGRFAWFRAYLDKTAQFSELSWKGKAQLLCWLLIKLLVDAVVWMVAALAWLLRFAFSTPERLRQR